MNKKRKCLIFIFLIISILVFVVLYIKTDMFKTKEQLFWKYFFLGTDEIASVISNEETEKYNASIKESDYIKESNMSIKSRFNLIKPINIKLYEKGKNAENCKNIFINVNYNNKNLEDTTIIKDENYFLVNNELMGSDYIAFENNNLKELAKDIGVPYADYIPDKIEDIDYHQLFLVTDGEMNYFLKKYIPIFRKHINSKNYIKKDNVKLDEKNDSVTLYEVTVSEKQLNSLIIDILRELYEDKESLKFISDKIKILDSDSEYINIDNIMSKIDTFITYMEKKEINNKDIFSIIVYKNDEGVIKIELVLKNNRTISVQTNGTNEIIIKQYGIKDKDINIKTIDGIINTVLNTITEITYTKSVVDNSFNKVNVNVVCNIGMESIVLNYNYVEQVKSDVEGLIRKVDVHYLDLNEFNIKGYIDTIYSFCRYPSNL